MALIAQYLFEDNLLDETANNNDGTINGGGTEIYADGVTGLGFSFDGSTDIMIGDTPFDFERTDPFTISTWIKATSISVDNFIFGKNTGATGYQMVLRGGNNEIRVRLSNATDDRIVIDTLGVSILNGLWHQIVETYDGSSLASGVNIYVDSILVTTTSVVQDDLTQSILHNTEFVIGNQEESVTTKYFSGEQDFFSIYDTELTAVEVVDNYVDEGLSVIAPRAPSVSAEPATVIEGALIRINGKLFVGNDDEWQRV